MPTERDEATTEVQRTLLTVEARAPKARRVKVADITLEADGRKDDTLVSSIRRVGLLEPPVLVAVGDRYKVIAGRRRVAAVKLIAKQDDNEETATVEAKVFEEGTLSGGEMASLLLTENGNRSENPVVEMRAVQALVREGFTVAEIAASLGQSPQWVRRRQSLATLHPTLVKELKARRLTFTNAVRMAGMPESEQAMIVDELIGRRAADPRARAGDDAIRASRAVGEDRSAALFTTATPRPESPSVIGAAPAQPPDPDLTTFAAHVSVATGAVEGLYNRAVSEQQADPTRNPTRVNAMIRHLQVAAQRLGEAMRTAIALEEQRRREVPSAPEN
jgi:ParB-like chromosome segregation protein Spo0J